MAGFDNDVLYADNVDFTGTSPVSGQINQDGELLVGSSTPPYIRSYVPTGSDGVSITAGAGTLDFSLANVPNSALANSSVTLNAGSGISLSTTTLSLGGSVTISATGGAGVTSVSGTADRITSTGGATPVIDIAATYVGQTSIVTLGTVTTGTWNGTTIDVSHGGTGATSLTDGGVLVGSGTGAITALSVGSTGTLLVGTTGSDPAFATSANGDFTFTSATSGATRTLTVNNTSDTASSAAAIVANVAGGTAADPVFQATITAGQAWTLGLDNSDSDAFVVSASSALGTTNVMRVDTTGVINYPLQSCFMAGVNNQLNVTGDGTVYTVVFAGEVIDQNNDFDGTSTFTAPVTGAYQFNVFLRIQGLTTSHTDGNVILVTSNRNYQHFLGNYGAFKDNGSSAIGSTFASIADMDAADTATVTVTVSNGTKVVDINNASSRFSGFLAC